MPHAEHSHWILFVTATCLCDGALPGDIAITLKMAKQLPTGRGKSGEALGCRKPRPRGLYITRLRGCVLHPTSVCHQSWARCGTGDVLFKGLLVCGAVLISHKRSNSRRPMASILKAVASTLLAMASTLLAIASNPKEMASTLLVPSSATSVSGSP